MNKKLLWIILDGFGIGPDSPHNAVIRAQMKFYQNFWNQNPHTEIWTHGEAVGLPKGVMGNSEVGHMTLGAGTVLYQDLVRISQSIENKSFFSNSELNQFLQNSQIQKRPIHLFGLVSDGGVHSSDQHIYAFLEMSQKFLNDSQKIFIHAILDGRDTPPGSAAKYLSLLEQKIHSLGLENQVMIASLSGRFYAMDRDQRWERTEKYWNAILGQNFNSSTSWQEYLDQENSQGRSDEFCSPKLLKSEAKIQDQDYVFIANFRADRVRQLLTKIESYLENDHCLTMTRYESHQKSKVVFPPQEIQNPFGAHVSKLGKTQLRIAETEKYAHVTFFFNGGQEAQYPGEKRILIPSPKDVSTYDQKPEMSAFQITDQLCEQIQASKSPDFILVNYANADMVGHTGNLNSTILALKALDDCLAKVIPFAKKNGYSVILTADHGNAECMSDPDGNPHTQHTLNPVPWIVSPIHSSEKISLSGQSLADIRKIAEELIS